MGEIAAVSVSVTLGVLTLLGLLVRYALLPYLKENLIEPVKNTNELAATTNRQVTVNHHSSDVPTVLDRIEDVGRQVQVLAFMFDGHIDRHQREVDAIWKELRARKEARTKGPNS